MTDRIRLVLASASPRRRALLEAAGLEFEVRPTEVDEGLDPGLDPVQAATLLAERKARAGVERERSSALVIGADTIVALPVGGGWRLLGKPADEREAAAMLGSLSGSRHRVVTGVCVASAPGGALRTAAETTVVEMREITPQERDGYVSSGEWRDKAGGYAIQETADRFVVALEGGGFDNVVGLPVALTLELIDEVRRAGVGS
jgi:septum formation protein